MQRWETKGLCGTIHRADKALCSYVIYHVKVSHSVTCCLSQMVAVVQWLHLTEEEDWGRLRKITEVEVRGQLHRMAAPGNSSTGCKHYTTFTLD